MKDSDIFGYSLIVFGLGILAGFLIAPHKGEETREILRKYLKEYCGETCEFITEKAAQVGKKAQEYIEELKKGMEEAK
jgi:gas vesicle protein